MNEVIELEERTPPLRIALVLLVFVAFAGIGVANHEMWRDEHHAWLLARDAANPIALYENLRWDMTPGFWHFLLWIVTRFTHDPVTMQLLNLTFATTAAWVVLRYAPLPFLVRLLFVFGYYFAYEYAVISRVYALGTLFIVLLCALWKSRAAHPVAIGALLTLLAHTPSLYGVIAAGFFLLLLLADLPTLPESRKASLTAICIGGLGAITALVQTLPRGDNPFAAGKTMLAFEPERLEKMVRFFGSLFVPIPDASRYAWWNSNIVTGRSSVVDLVLAAIGLGMAVWLLRRSRVLLASWLMATAGVMFAAYQGGFVGMRHGGYVVILLVAAIWIARGDPAASPVTTRQSAVIVLWLTVGVLGGVTAWLKELGTEFSAVERTAVWLRANGLDQTPIAGADDFVVASLASLLDLDRIYYPQRSEWGTFVSWDPKRRLNTTLEDATVDVAAMVAASNQRMLFVLTRPPTRRGPTGEMVIREAMIGPGVRARLLAAFTESVVEDERMFVYDLAPVRSPR